MKKTLLILALLFVAVPVQADFQSNLYYGLTNNSDVQALQEFLATQGMYSGPITGNFFSLTLAGVERFQNSQNISSTGYFGPLSRAAANSILASEVTYNETSTSTVTVTATPSPILSTTTEASTTNDLCAVLSTPSGVLVNSCTGTVVYNPASTTQTTTTSQPLTQTTTVQSAPSAPALPPPPTDCSYGPYDAVTNSYPCLPSSGSTGAWVMTAPAPTPYTGPTPINVKVACPPDSNSSNCYIVATSSPNQ